MRRSVIGVSLWVLTAVAVSACSGLSNARKIDYRNTAVLPSLEVPPDLSDLPEPNVPGVGQNTPAGAATYSGYAGEKGAQTPGTLAVLPQYPGVRLAREGQTRFVVVQAEPAAVWGQVRDFLTNTGLSIAKENPRAGLMETHWAENRALIGKKGGIIKWLASFYSTGTRDKYRIRLERGVTPGTTEIYLSHQGMEELPLDETGSARPGWTPRPSDPELEAEMLQRLVVHLGGERTPETAVAQAEQPASAQTTPEPASARPPNALLTRSGNGTPLLTLEDSLDRAWRRVGLSLDRIGFTVEDRDRTKGIYYVRYIDPDNRPDEKGFFSRLFSGDEPAPTNQYLVQVKPAENGTNVEVLNGEGGPATSKTGERILSLLYEQLK